MAWFAGFLASGSTDLRQDVRGKRYIAVIECLLNQNARDSGAARYAAFNPGVLALCARYRVGLL
jgi:hypothetical protein